MSRICFFEMRHWLYVSLIFHTPLAHLWELLCSSIVLNFLFAGSRDGETQLGEVESVTRNASVEESLSDVEVEVSELVPTNEKSSYKLPTSHRIGQSLMKLWPSICFKNLE